MGSVQESAKGGQEDQTNQSEEENLTEEQKLELLDSTDSEISVIDFSSLLEAEGVMKGKKVDEEPKQTESTSSSSYGRYSREPAEKDENNSNNNEGSLTKSQDTFGNNENNLSGDLTNLSNNLNNLSENLTTLNNSKASSETSHLSSTNNSKIKFKKFDSPIEIRDFFEENTPDIQQLEDMNCYNYMDNECKTAQCECYNNTQQQYDGQEYNYCNQETCPRKDYNNYHQSRSSQSQNYQENVNYTPSHQTPPQLQSPPQHQSPTQMSPYGSNHQQTPSQMTPFSSNHTYPNDSFGRVSKTFSKSQEDNNRSRQSSGYSYSSPEVMNHYKSSGQFSSNEFQTPNNNNNSSKNDTKYPVEESESDIALYKKQAKKQYKHANKPKKGCPCCNCNYYENDEQDSSASENSRSSEYMDLAYQQQGDYPNLVDELEDTITQRNRERVQRTLQHFEMISSGMKEPSPLDLSDKPSYNNNYAQNCPCQKYKAKANRPCYCMKGQCQYCDKYCKLEQQQQQPQQKCDPQCRGVTWQLPPNYHSQQQNYHANKGSYVEKVVKNMDPNLNESVQKYPKFQGKFNNTHWRFDTRSGEWIKVCERNFDYDNNYPPLPPPPPINSGNEQMYNTSDRRPSCRHQDYTNASSHMQQQNQDNYNLHHHKKNCMCNNCGMHRNNRRY